MGENPDTSPEAVFLGPAGEHLTADEYIRWELEEMLRYVHERSATRGLGISVERPQGVLFAIATADHPKLGLYEIAANSADDFDLERLETNLNGLVNAGLLVKPEDSDGFSGQKYSLAVSNADWLETSKKQSADWQQAQLERREARRAKRNGSFLGKLFRWGDTQHDRSS